MTRFRLPKLGPRRWLLRDIRRTRLTRWLLIGSVLMMLGMQSALAAYACAMPPAAVGSTMAMSASAMDASMGHSCPEMKHAAVDRMLCAKHCAPDTAAPTNAHPLSVPPSLLTALPLVLPVLTVSTQGAIKHARRDRLRAPGPPASLLFCSLLI
ncbi:MAG TPA: hypothetical protein VGC19_09560 [Rhodanobacter sp.]